MKKTTLILLAAAMILASCSSYTCPTYSKVPQNKAGKEMKI
ncbi:MAG TPA: hypothetical protein PLR06_14385 [Cyclobacteriaceae bacterium]|nr:hypothetical protein [Cyclobacteriaceae bacterium]